MIASATQFVEAEVAPRFHDKLLAGLTQLKLKRLLKRKNPYLFKAKAVVAAADLVRQLLIAHLSSTDETIFGDFLEALAIHVCAESYGGHKSTSEGIDLEFVRDSTRYIVSIKSGPNWANSQQLKRMKSNFAQAQRIAGRTRLVAVNGCCYGQEANSNKGEYLKLCGEEFWELISGDEDFYQRIIDPLGSNAKLRTEEFAQKFGQVENQFTGEFIAEFCNASGAIDWDKLLRFNSGRVDSKKIA